MNLNRGTPPLAFAQQEARRRGELDAVQPNSQPMETDPISPASPPSPRMSGRLFPVTLTYNPPPGTHTPGGDPLPSISIKFKARSVDIKEHFISLNHSPDIDIEFTAFAEDLICKIGEKAYPVSWVGSTFSFPDNDVYGIQLLRRQEPPGTSGS
jgi:hypothetical protein